MGALKRVILLSLFVGCGTETPAQLVVRISAEPGVARSTQCLRVAAAADGNRDVVDLPINDDFPKFVVVTPRHNATWRSRSPRSATLLAPGS